MKTIEVFISSAMRELEYEREIAQECLKGMSLKPVLFELFPAMSNSPNQAYLDNVRNCDIFLLILWQSFSSAVREEYFEAVKYNKPILIFTKTMAGNEKRKKELVDFLKELNAPNLSSSITRTIYKDYRSLEDFKTRLRDSLFFEISKFYQEPINTSTREDMYLLGSSIIKYSQKKLILFQKTPSLFLGAREYLADDKNKYFYEQDFLNTLEEWVKTNYQASEREFLYLFSLDDTRKELADKKLFDNKYFIQRMGERIKYFKKIECDSSYRFRFSVIEKPISGPIIVGDRQYAIWVLGGDDAVSISQENVKISEIIIKMLKSHSERSMSAENMFDILSKPPT